MRVRRVAATAGSRDGSGFALGKALVILHHDLSGQLGSSLCAERVQTAQPPQPPQERGGRAERCELACVPGLTSRARTCHVDPVLRTCATLTSSASSIRSARAGDQLVLLTKSATSERPIPVVSHTGHSISRRRHPIPASSSCSLRYYVATRLGWFANGGRMRICCRRWWAGLMTTGLQIA